MQLALQHFTQRGQQALLQALHTDTVKPVNNTAQ
jgi:hypothetical protein